mmetsp:Transcript_18174/g.25679  ORF Transcript_18174/g.25679 Transcript_18174/m.25679 type:complete len:158 (-) Transcript_18174:235-708(-)
MPIADICKDILRWLKEEGHGMFEHMLQCEHTSEIGWLAWMMEAYVLAEAISTAIGIQVGLCWKMISTGTRGKIPQEQQVRALHVEVDSSYQMLAQKALLSTYGKQNSGNYPNGVHLRFVLPISAAYNTHTRSKLEWLKARQQLWSKSYKTTTSWEIT